MDLVSNCGVLRPPDLFPNLLHHPVLQLDFSHLLCLGWNPWDLWDPIRETRSFGGEGGMTLVNDWVVHWWIFYCIYILYIYISKKNPDPSSYLLCISCFWGENQKRVHIPSGWILFRLAYGVHRNRWNLSFQLALVPEFSMSATSKGSKFDLSPQWKNGGWSSGFPFRKFMISEISQSFKKKSMPAARESMYPCCFPAPGNISPATWCLEDETLPFEMVPFQQTC